MEIPFTVKEFLDVFGYYNTAVWPFQGILLLLALLIILLTIKKHVYSDQIISAALAFLWFWTGIVYHFLFFTKINPAAYVFAIVTVLQGFLFLVFGVIRKEIAFSFSNSYSGIAGIVLIVYALIIYPLLGLQFGHLYPRTPTFGLPCPTTIFTFGIFLWTKPRMNPVLLGIPLVWSIVGFTAALNLGIYQDIGLIVSALISASIIIFRNRSLASRDS